MISPDKPEGFSAKIEICSTIVLHDSKILLLKTHSRKSEEQPWGFPVGKRESGESFEEGARRELFEESGIEADVLEFLETLHVTKTPIGDVLYHQFILKLDDRPEVILSDHEHTNFAWLSIEEALSRNLIFDHDLCIKRYLI